ncbi:MAG: hypothetical protein ACTHM9_07925 [Gemmatimonadales bacterium]|jgi:hypothetical protein
MTACTRLSDRMPAVAHGLERWTDDEERHLAACEDCRTEWAVVSAGSRLGLALAPAEPSRTAAVVLARLERERHRARMRSRAAAMGGLAAAAAVALVLLSRSSDQVMPGLRERAPGGVAAAPTPRVPQRPEPPLPGEATTAALELPLPELDSLPAEALDSMLKSLDEPLAQVAPDDVPPDDSGDQELAHALAGREG